MDAYMGALWRRIREIARVGEEGMEGTTLRHTHPRACDCSNHPIGPQGQSRQSEMSGGMRQGCPVAWDSLLILPFLQPYHLEPVS